ncbi:hypothetical protein C0J52_24550 [Blattella germanica]|nr:hypothetical protein C0J52_24550 [Blattella germanica]
MPKEKNSSVYLQKEWVSGNSDYSRDGVVVYCQVCSNKNFARKRQKNSTPQQLLLTRLYPETCGRPYLLAWQTLEKTNYSTIARSVNNPLRHWPSEVENNYSKVHVLVTDSATYIC